MQSKPTILSKAGAFGLATILVFLAGTPFTFAQTTNVITLTNSDTLGVSSFNAVGNWNSGAAPVSGNPNFNAYFTTNYTLRTPADGNNYTFAGDSLSIDPLSTNIVGSITNIGTGTLSIKGYGTITAGNLILNGGKIVNNGTGGNPDTALLAGKINVTANSTLDGGGTAGVTALNMLAPMAGNGGIAIADNGTVIYSATNTYTGNTTIGATSVLQMNAVNSIPNGPGNGILTLNPSTTAGAILDLNGFDTAANDIASGTGVAQIINSAVGTTNTLTVDIAVGGKTYKGLIKDNNGTGGTLALNIIGSSTVSSAWVVASPLTYSGDTTINGGRLAMGASNILPWGPGKGNLVVNGAGILDMDGRTEQINGLSGNGIIDNLTTGTGHSTINCGSNDVSSTFSGVIQNSQYLSFLPADYWIQIAKFGAGTLTLTGTNTYNGNVAIHAGAIRITYQNGDGTTGGGLGLGSETTPPTKTISIDSSLGDAGLYLDATNGVPIAVDSSILFQTAGTNGAIVNEAGSNIINGTISLRTGGGTTIRVDGDTLNLAGNLNILSNTTSRTLTLSGAANGTVSGVIADGSSATNPNTNILSLIKSGLGTWTLANNNTYSDVTTINGGTLLVNGTLSTASAVTVATGTLGGGGTIGGNVTVANNSAAIIHPGGGSTLTLGSNLTFNASSGATFDLSSSVSAGDDQLVLNGANSTLTCGGAQITINSAGTLATSDYVLFNVTGGSSGISGSFNPKPAWSGTTPGNAANYSIVTSGQQVLLHYGSAAAPEPHLTSISLSGTSLIISGTNGLTGEQYVELTSTNVALALANWTPVVTNTFGGGNFNITNTVNPNAPHNFYILKVQ